jgi:hypothetical protein
VVVCYRATQQIIEEVLKHLQGTEQVSQLTQVLGEVFVNSGAMINEILPDVISYRHKLSPRL